jgi:hypothetical protein
MYCPECGTDAADAKFCPECGNDLGAVKDALRGSSPAGKPAGQAAQQRKSAKQSPASATEAGGRGPGQLGPRKQPGGAGTKPWVIWAVVGAVVVPLILITLVSLIGNNNNKSKPGATASLAPVANTSGTYPELVQRANDLYDAARAAYLSGDINTELQYGAAAAKVYAAAWKKQPGDPGVGTDWARALFYAGDFKGAIIQIEKIIAANPTYQKAWLNAGDLYAADAQMTQDKVVIKADLAKAKRAYAQTIALNAINAVGLQAKASLKTLPK